MGSTRQQKKWSQIFETLRSIVRREILATLLENPPGTAVDLPEAANSPEHRRDPEQLVTNLHHRHLPAMANKGYIEWQEEPFCVGRGPRFNEFTGVMKAIQSSEQVPQELMESCYFLQQDGAKT